MNKIGLIFGSFNPLHKGHLKMADKALDNGIVDEVCFVIARQNPFKPPYEVSNHHRVHMLNLLYDYHDRKCWSSTIEFSEKEIPDPRTYNVLEFFKKNCVDTKFVIICGSDIYNEIPKWYKGEELLKEEIYVIPRTLDDISSSEIRHKIKQGQDFKDLVPIQIYDYIKRHNLYVNNTET